jgi:hypothetical protein
MEDIKPNTFSNQTTTQITTTAFRIDLIEPAMGMNVFINHSKIPTTIKAMTTCIKGIASTSLPNSELESMDESRKEMDPSSN